MSDKVADLIKGYVDLEIMHFWEILSEKWHSSKNKSPDPFSKKIATTLRDFQKDLIETKYENEFLSKEGYIKKIDEVYKKHQENILKYLRDNLKEIESLKNNSEFNSILECKEGRIDFCLSFLNKSAKVKICPELQGKKLFSIEDIRSEEIQIKLSILYSMLFHLQLHETSRNHFYFLDQYKDSKDSNLLKIIECLWYLIKFLTDKSKDFNDNELKKDAINLLKIIFLIRRGFAYDLSSQPQKAFNDFSKVQAILSELKTESQKKYYTILVSYIYSLKGDLYRRNYCFYNAHQYYCNCIETIEKFEEESEKFEDESKSSQDQEFNIFYSLKKVKIKINKGKTFLTLGEFKKSLKWFFNALEDLLKIVQKQEEKKKKEENISKLIESIQNISKYLEEQKLENYIGKNKLSKKINDFIELIEKVQISKYPNLISDILVRISYILILLKVKKEKANDLPNSLLTRALKFNKFNALACLNRLILNREDKSSNEDIPDITSLMHYGNLQDVIYRNFFISILAELNKLSFQQNGSRKDNDLINPETAKNLLKEAISISEDFSVKNAEMYRFLMRNGAISQCNERDGRPYFDEDYVYLYGLQRWSSINPAVIRPSAFKIKGGGLLIIYKGKGIAIDPGINFVENLYAEGFSLEDIHYIIVSHDHIDHLGDLDILLSLFYRRSQLEPKEKKETDLSFVESQRVI